LHPLSLESRLAFFDMKCSLIFNYSGPVGIWIKIHLNPDAEISIPTSNHWYVVYYNKQGSKVQDTIMVEAPFNLVKPSELNPA